MSNGKWPICAEQSPAVVGSFFTVSQPLDVEIHLQDLAPQADALHL